MTVATDYAYWRKALQGDFGPVHDGDAHCGFWRVRDGKKGPWLPVAIWRGEDGELRAIRGDAPTDAGAVWSWCCRYPVAEEAYRAALAGGGWPDDAPAPAGIGHNMPGDDPLDVIRTELAGEVETTAEFLAKPVEAQEQADKASVWAKRVGEIAKRADETRKAEKEPHLQASRAVDDKWRPVIDEAKELAGRLKKHVEPFLIAQKRAEEERARKAREEADRLRREAEEAQRKAAEPDQQSEAERAELLRRAQEADKAAATKNASAGRTGARVALRTDKRARVTDYHAAAKALLDANHAELKEKIDQLAQRAVRAGGSLAGVEVDEIERAA